jgi:NMT1-like family
MAPPEMPAAPHASQVDAYATGEPFGPVAEVAGYARILYMTRDKWPNYVCCVLTVHQELIDKERPLVQQLVNHVLSAGAWLETAQANRDLAARVAGAPAVFNQQPEILRHVLTNPRDRVTYADLRLIQSEMDDLMEAALGPVALLFVVWHVAVVASQSRIFPTPWQVAVGPVELGRRDQGARRGQVTKCLAVLAAAAVVTLTLAAGAWAAFAPLATGSRELTFVIPPGTAARLKEGTPLTVLPSPIHLTMGVRDVLVITNDDEVIHQVGPIILGPRQTYRIPFRRPGRSQYACSLHAAGTLTLVIDPEPAAGLERLRWRLDRFAARS